jgi:hypothetical protein
MKGNLKLGSRRGHVGLRKAVDISLPLSRLPTADYRLPTNHVPIVRNYGTSPMHDACIYTIQCNRDHHHHTGVVKGVCHNSRKKE